MVRLSILLHGFPEAWFCWRHQIGPLAEAGYRVLAPDQRGYNTSEKPARIADYALDMLAADVLGLIDRTGSARATLVGHDWGGIVAWWVALRYPERVQRLAVLNAPHPVAFRRYLFRHPAQLRRSWYAFYFQLPRLPESNFRRANWQALVRTLCTTSRPGTFRDDDLAQYRQAWSEPGAITAMIHWYRAALRHRPPAPPDPRVRVPTLMIWGKGDAFLLPGTARGQHRPLRQRPARMVRGGDPLGAARGARARQSAAARTVVDGQPDSPGTGRSFTVSRGHDRTRPQTVWINNNAPMSARPAWT